MKSVAEILHVTSSAIEEFATIALTKHVRFSMMRGFNASIKESVERGLGMRQFVELNIWDPNTWNSWDGSEWAHEIIDDFEFGQVCEE